MRIRHRVHTWVAASALLLGAVLATGPATADGPVVPAAPPAPEEVVLTDLGPASPSVSTPGGLLTDTHAYISSSRSISVLDRATGQVTSKPMNVAGAWGFTEMDGEVYAASRWPGAVWHIGEDATPTRLTTGDYTYLWDITPTPDGQLFFGSYPTANFRLVDPDTGQVTDLGPAVAGQQYIRSVAADEGHLYAGVGAQAHLIVLDRATGTRTNILPAELSGDSFVYDLQVTDEYVIGSMSPSNKVVIIDKADPTSYRIVQPDPQLEGGGGADALAVRETAEGTTIYVTQRPTADVYAIDAATGEATYLATPTPGQEHRSLYLEGDSLVGFAAAGQMWTLDLTDNSYDILDLQEAGMEPAPELGASLTASPTEVIVGGSFGMQVHDLAAGTSERVRYPGEAKVGLIMDRTAYFGTYPSGGFDSLDLDAREVSRLELWGGGQIRPRDMIHHEGQFLIGTQPEYGTLEGGLVVVDDQTFESTVHRNVVRNQSVSSVAAIGRTAFLGTEIDGGLGTRPTERQAVLAEFDLDSGTVVSTMVPVAGVGRISSLVTTKDGTVIGSTSNGTVFEYDPATNRVLRTQKFGSRPHDLELHGNELFAFDGDRALQIDVRSWSSRVLASGLNGFHPVQGDFVPETRNYYVMKGMNLLQITVPRLQRDTLDPNLVDVAASTAGGVASASGTEKPQYAPAKANDGIVNKFVPQAQQSRWSSEPSDNAWIQVEFAQPTILDQVAIEWEILCAKTYRLQVSTDGQTWVDATGDVSPRCDSRDVQRLSALTPAQQAQPWTHLRMQASKRTPHWDGRFFGVSLWELEVYGARPGAIEVGGVVAGQLLAEGTRKDLTVTLDEDVVGEPAVVLVDQSGQVVNELGTLPAGAGTHDLQVEIPAIGAVADGTVLMLQVRSGSTILASTDLTVVPPYQPTGTPFTDVPDDHPAFVPISWMRDSGIDTGRADGTYRPDEKVSRAQMAQYLYLAAGSPEVTVPDASPYRDVTPADEAYEAIVWAQGAGLMDATDGRFRPSAKLTRGETAVLAHRVAGSPELPTDATSPFPDLKPGSAGYAEILWQHQEGLIPAPQSRAFRPNAPLTRADAASLLFELVHERNTVPGQG